jgi:hypothetical protein
MREEMDLFVGNQLQGSVGQEGFGTYAKTGFTPSQFIQVGLKTLPEVIQY